MHIFLTFSNLSLQRAKVQWRASKFLLPSWRRQQGGKHINTETANTKQYNMNYTYTISVKHGHSVKTDITPKLSLCVQKQWRRLELARSTICGDFPPSLPSNGKSFKWQEFLSLLLPSAASYSFLAPLLFFFFNFLGYDQKENRSIWIFLSDNRFIQNSLAPYFFCKNFPDNI